MRKLILGITALLSVSTVFAEGSANYARLSLTVHESFRCGMYAVFAGKEDLVPDHYEKGISAGRTFLAAAREGDIPNEVWQNHIPMYIGWIVRDGGPSTDFMLGRVFEQATSMASDDVIKNDAYGMELPADQWRFDKDLQNLVATNRYQSANCWALLRDRPKTDQ